MANMYFAKVNANSNIHQIYKDPRLLDKILTELVVNINENRRIEITKKIDKNHIGDKIKFITLDKDVSKMCISGRLIRIYTDDLEGYDSSQDDIVKLETGELARYSTFYFDLRTELIGFTLGKYFNCNKFCLYFETLINSFSSNTEFKIILRQDREELQQKIKRFKRISSIYVSTIIPNINNVALNKMFGANAQNMKEMNANEYDQNFKSNGTKEGLDPNIPIINNFIEGVSEGYGKMKIEGKDDSGEGITVNSVKDSPYKRPIRNNEKNSMLAVKEIAQKWIKRIAVQIRG